VTTAASAQSRSRDAGNYLSSSNVGPLVGPPSLISNALPLVRFRTKAKICTELPTSAGFRLPGKAGCYRARRAVPSPAPTFRPGWCGKGGRSQTTCRSLRSLMRPRQRSPSVSAFGRNRSLFD